MRVRVRVRFRVRVRVRIRVSACDRGSGLTSLALYVNVGRCHYVVTML